MCLGLPEVFLARSRYREIERLPIHRQLGFGHSQRRFRILELLVAYDRIFRQRLAALLLSACICSISRRGFDIRPGLGDLFRTAAIA